MNMRIKYLLPVVALLLITDKADAQTAKQDRIDQEYEVCLKKDTSYANISTCAFEAYGKWDKEMTRTLKKLVSTVKKDKDKAALQQSQKAWMAYRDAEFNNYNNLFNKTGNQWSMLRQDGRVELVRSRTIQLRYYLDQLKAH